MLKRLVITSSLLLLLSGCQSTICSVNQIEKSPLNYQSLLTDLEYLASDELEGRKVGSKGSELARNFIQDKLKQANIAPFKSEYEHHFRYKNDQKGINVIGIIPGKISPERYIVISAHYDHLGIIKQSIHNGADDNASGVAGMLAIAEQLAKQGTNYSIIILATDAEEPGLYGAKAFIDDNAELVEKIQLNVNLDMIAQNKGKNRLYVAGTRSVNDWKDWQPALNRLSHVCLKTGHDHTKLRGFSGEAPVDWKNASDHAVFRIANIPYLFFSVELHPYYHTSNDDFELIDTNFYWGTVNTILNVVNLADQKYSH